MSYEKRIHDYLSGELNAEEERRLFDDLSANPHWQEELSLQLKMQQAAQKDLGMIAVPPSATAAIFSSLSFSPPEVTKAASVVKGNTGSSAFSLPGGSFTVFSVATILTIGCLTYLLLKFSTNEATPAPVNPTAVSVMPASRSTSVKQPISEVSGQQSKHRNTETSTARISQRSSIALPRTIPNEPIKFYFDIGKFSSVDYLTQHKIIGVADQGKIYCSEDDGRSWVIQSSGTVNDLLGINFIDTSRGVVVGSNGTILLTTDAGRQWKSISSGIKATLMTVRYATPDTVFACGASGTILRSTTRGEEWKRLESGTTASLFKIRFDNGSNGIISGEHSLVLETHNAGESWKSK